jgi:hypothetical protein
MKYTRGLENEIARLREENRRLVNSILGLADIPPMPRYARQRRALAAGESGRPNTEYAAGRAKDAAPVHAQAAAARMSNAAVPSQMTSRR